MYRVKQLGGLGLHAGSKRLRVRRDGELTTVGQLFLGLSATGKTTLTCHDFGLSEPESATMVQDDVCALLPDGTVAGSEGPGLYIKTIGLSPDEHRPLYEAVSKPDAILENVRVDPDGQVDFADDRYTSNTRAVINREHIAHAAAEIDLESVDQVFFITRNPLMPPVAKLDPAQAAAAFMLGESIQTSAGNPDKAGEAVRVVGTNPFIVGPPGEEGNRFYELLAELGMESYILNTGQVGVDGRDIAVEATVAIIRAIARASIDWTNDEQLGLWIPESVPDLDINRFYPPEIVPDFPEKYRQLIHDRRKHLAQYEELNGDIIDAVF